MQPHKYLPNYTVEDYTRWEGDWELIDGIPYAMSPSPVGSHQLLGASLITQIKISLKTRKEYCGDCYLYYEFDWILSDNTVVRPDLAVTCNKATDFMRTPPVLIIEILSPSTALKDRHQKFEIYQGQGVKYYVVADPISKSYQIFVLANGQYQEQNNLASFNIHDKRDIEINLPEALAELED